jgi:hypothetical protein
MTTLIFIVALACFTGANAQSIELGEGTYLQYKGEIGIEGSYFPVDSEVPNQIDRVGLINSSFDLTLQTDFSIDIKIKPRFYYELGDNDVEFSQGQVVGENKIRLMDKLISLTPLNMASLALQFVTYYQPRLSKL